MRNNIFLTFCFLAILVSKSYSQTSTVQSFINVENVPVHLYSDRLSERVIHTIMNDSIFEHWYVVEIFQESSLRYEVDVQCLQYNSPKIHGWIDKKYCSVYLAKIQTPLLLYSSPDEKSKYISISLTQEICAMVCHVEKNGFIFVEFQYGSNNYYGWINEYCSSPINNCN